MISFATGARSLCVVLTGHSGRHDERRGAERARVQCPPPRTIYTFTDSSSIQALPGAPGPFCRFANVNGGQQVDLFLGAFSAASPIVQANIDVLTSLLPLQVGKAVHLARAGPADRGWQANVDRGEIRDRRGAGRPAELLRPALDRTQRAGAVGAPVVVLPVAGIRRQVQREVRGRQPGGRISLPRRAGNWQASASPDRRALHVRFLGELARAVARGP